MTGDWAVTGDQCALSSQAFSRASGRKHHLRDPTTKPLTGVRGTGAVHRWWALMLRTSGLFRVNEFHTRPGRPPAWSTRITPSKSRGIRPNPRLLSSLSHLAPQRGLGCAHWHAAPHPPRCAFPQTGAGDVDPTHQLRKSGPPNPQSLGNANTPRQHRGAATNALVG